MAHRWYYWANEEKRGPVSGQILRDLADIGKIQPTSYLLCEKSQQRVQAVSVPGLFANLGWYFTKHGKQHGPVTAGTLKHLAECLELLPTDFVWKNAMSDWVPAAEVRGLFRSRTHDATGTDLYLCESCGNLGIEMGDCAICGPESRQTRLVPGTGVGLIGLPDTGKTCYLAALHDQLMHSAPDWRVRVSDRAFETLTSDFWKMNDSGPAKTELGVHDSAGFFKITVIHGDKELPFVLNDMAGEYTYSMTASFDDEHNRDAIYFHYLRQCRGLLVAIPCWRLRGALDGVRHPFGENDQEEIRKADTVLARLFRNLTSAAHHVKHVESVLVGVDVFGGDPAEAVAKASDSFGRLFRSFPGVLKNAGVTFGSTPVSNIGFGNEVGLNEAMNRRKIFSPPHPFNVLAPIQRILEPASAKSLAVATATPAATSIKRSRDTDHPKAFLSYRRENGAETARLLKSSLEVAGWQAFLDVDDLGASYFDDRLLLEIQLADAVILILSPGSLDRCTAPGDWLRREIGHAVKCGKRIVPLTQNGFRFSEDQQLPPEIAQLTRLNCVEYSHQYYQATLDRLLKYLIDK